MTVRDLDIRKLIISVLIWTALNAGIVILFEACEWSVTAEVAISAVFCVLWVIYAAVFCRRKKEQEK